MARFLFASMPSAGHTNPLRPIARALTGAGHTVDWYCAEPFRTAIEATGATFTPAPPGLGDLPAGREGLTGLDGIRFDLKHLFLDPVPQQVDDLTRLLTRLRPDALIADMGLVGASAVHELTGIDWISVGISPLPLPSRDTAPFGTALPPFTEFTTPPMSTGRKNPAKSYTTE